VRQQLRLDAMGVEHQLAPRLSLGRKPARQRSTTGLAHVAGRNLAFAGQHREHLGVRSQQHRIEWHVQVVGQPAQRRDEIARDLRFMLGCARLGIKAPPRDYGEPTADEHITPVLAICLSQYVHGVSPHPRVPIATSCRS
jgi:hypothetical protein